MKNPDAAIEQVLGGMRASAVPDGLERRVLAAVRERAAVRESAAMGMRGWMMVGASAALVVAIAIGFGGRGRQAQVAVQAPVAGSAGVPRPVVAVPRDSNAVRMIGVRRVSAAPQVTAAAVASESLEMQEMRAASEVAPAMPLTADERLLRRMAQSRGAAVLATAEAAEEAARVEPEKNLKPVFLPGFEETNEPAAKPVVEQSGSGENEWISKLNGDR